ncbi:MAG: acyclic terpene utilization AtuA family protein [Acidimicrobiales bacterium]
MPGIERCGFPIAEVHADGSSVITKHPGTGGLVSVGTVTAQLLYEIQGREYANPDVVTRFDTIHLDQEGPDRVRISGVRGLPGPGDVKVAVNYLGGWRNSMTFVLTGLDIEAKAAVAERTLWSLLPGGRDGFEAVAVDLRRTDHPDPATNDDALAELRVTVMDRDKEKVGRAFSNTVIEMVLASYPGFFTTSPPTDASSFGVYWPTLVPADVPHHEVVLDGPGGPDRVPVAALSADERATGAEPAAPITAEHETILAMSETNTQFAAADWDTATLQRVPLGRVAGARSGDKGGNANIGVWARTEGLYRWLHTYLTADRLRELLPETADLDVHRYDLPNLSAMNFIVVGLLGRGVAASTRTDPQAKGLGEYLRAKVVDVPAALLADLPAIEPAPA